MNAAYNRLRWQCRRGLLELDLVLHAFVEREYAKLTLSERDDFARLLEMPDQTLFAWLQGDTHDLPAAFAALLAKLR